MPQQATRVAIEGRVQGVGFRAWAAREAAKRQLAGWVRNRADGSVEALFSGDAAAVAAMVEACRLGPRLAAVTSVAAFAAEPTPQRSFEVRTTA